MDQLFVKTHADVIKMSKTIGNMDPLTFLTQLTTDVKNELKNPNEATRQQAILKLFYLATEGVSVKWAEFNIINSMGSNDYLTKRYAFLAAPLVIDGSSQGLIMVTNLFKKDLQKSQNIVECSTALSCVGSICNKDLCDSIIQYVIQLQGNSKPVIRKKAIAVLSKMFTLCPHLIPNNLEKVVTKLSTDENSPNVLACGVSMMSQVLKITPSLYPLFLKFIYDHLQKQKSNWLLIKLVRICNKIIQLEPRFQKKLIEPFTRLLNQTSSKSLQYELIYSIMKFFKDQKSMFENACELLKTFIDRTDPNLRSLGLECLTQMLEANPKQLLEFQQQLEESFVKSDFFAKIQILQIFKDFTTQPSYTKVSTFLLQMVNDEQDQQLKGKIIDSLSKYNKIQKFLLFLLVWISQKNKFENISDVQSLLLQLLPTIALRAITQENANGFRDLILDLLTRSPNLYQYSDRFCNQILTGFEQCQKSERFNDGVTIQVISIQGIKKETDPKETIFKTLIMILAESVNLMSMQTLLKQISFISESKILSFNSNSTQEVHSLLFKVQQFITCFCRMVKENQQKHMNEIEEFLKKQQLENLDKNLNKVALAWVFQKYLQVSRILSSIEQTHTMNIYQKIIFSGVQNVKADFLNEYIPSLQQSESIVIKDSLYWIQDKQNELVEELSQLTNLYSKSLPPLHQDAQRLVKQPEQLDLATPFDIDMEEVRMIKELNDAQMLQDQPEKDKQLFQQVLQTENEIMEQKDQEQPPQINEDLPQVQFTINRDELLPPGVTKSDIEQLNRDDDE